MLRTSGNPVGGVEVITTKHLTSALDAYALGLVGSFLLSTERTSTSIFHHVPTVTGNQLLLLDGPKAVPVPPVFILKFFASSDLNPKCAHETMRHA